MWKYGKYLLLCLWLAAPAYANIYKDLQFCRAQQEPEPSPTCLVNNFIANSGKFKSRPAPTQTVANLQMAARLLTALNSNFTYIGYPVQAVVINSPGKPAPAFLPAGTRLQGYVENCNLNARMSQHGSIFLRFYRAYTGNSRLDIDLIADTTDGALHPWQSPKKPSAKAAFRELLILSSNIAVPCAIGSGGMSLAITAGAGMILGAALADDGKYVQGAFRGAWQGAGLSRLDPLVCKGRPVILPWGTAIALRQTSAWNYPTLAKNVINRPQNVISYPPILATSARLLTPDAPNAVASDTSSKDLQKIQSLLEQKNLAAALEAAEQCYQRYPGNQEVSSLHWKLLQLVRGETTGQNL